MPYLFIQIPESVREKLEQRGISEQEVERIVHSAAEGSEATSRSSNRPMFFGELSDGRMAVVVFEYLDRITIEVITAYPVE